jgi:hypothetical protein
MEKQIESVSQKCAEEDVWSQEKKTSQRIEKI